MAEREIFGVVRGTMSASSWHTLVAFSGRANRLDYRDPGERSTGVLGIDNRYLRYESALLIRTLCPIAEHGVFEATAEVSHARLNGNNLDPDAHGTVDRVQWGVTAGGSWQFEHAASGNALAVDAALRADGFSDVASALSPSFGLSYRPLGGPLRLRVRGALNYRAPSFTEQYYLNYGNTDLQPERSMSLDAGATLVLASALVVEAGAFMIDTRDQIVAVPMSPLVWTAQNVARTLSRGIELGISGTILDGLIAMNVAYTRMRAEDRTRGATFGNVLIYTPEEVASVLLEFRPAMFGIGTTLNYVSHRHTLPSNAIGAVLPHYATLNAHVAARATVAGLNCTARVEGFNLLDEQYQVVRNYPMPGRAIRIGVEVAYALP